MDELKGPIVHMRVNIRLSSDGRVGYLVYVGEKKGRKKNTKLVERDVALDMSDLGMRLAELAEGVKRD